jgi:hypothetical protein
MRTPMEKVRHDCLKPRAADHPPLLPHRTAKAYDLFGNQREGVVKVVALTPSHRPPLAHGAI